MCELAKRLLNLDGRLRKSFHFKIYFLFASIIPRFALGIIKDVAFYKYSRFSKTKETEIAIKYLKVIEEEFVNAKNIK